MKCVKYFYVLLLLFHLSSHSQNLSGTWTGNCEGSLFVANPVKIVLELYQHQDSIITGVSHWYYKRGKYEHHKIHGKFIKSDSTVFISEDSIIAFQFPGADICSGIYTMKYSVNNDSWHLAGKWQDKKKGMFSCPASKIWFRKEGKGSDMQDVANNRINDIQRVIEIDNAEKDSITIEIFDNGIVDDDTISVRIDDQFLIRRVRLTDKPVSLTFGATREIHKLILVAENLGTVSPNTALMIIRTKKRTFNIHLSSDQQKNAVVEFFLKPTNE